MTEEERFERLYVDTVMDIAITQQKRTKKEMGEYVFGNDRILHAVLGSTKTGEPQRITLAQSYKMAQFIRWRFFELIQFVQAKLDQEVENRKRNN